MGGVSAFVVLCMLGEAIEEADFNLGHTNIIELRKPMFQLKVWL